jgi:hypothetical protein
VTRKLVLNIAPILFEDAEIAVEVHPYTDKENLDSLRDRTRGTHVVRRDGGDRVLCVPSYAFAMTASADWKPSWRPRAAHPRW